MYNELTTPSVIVHLDIAERNIETMAQRLKQAGIAHRPHIKTHKSIALGRKQVEAGAIGITTAKLGEAEVFAEAGFDNILVAYPLLGQDKLQRFAALHERITVITTMDSMEVARGLSSVGAQTNKPVQALIEIDLGMHRCGVQPENAVAFAEEVRRTLPGVEIVGLMEYNSLVRKEKTDDEKRAALKSQYAVVSSVAEELRNAGFRMDIVSAGSTVAATYPDAVQGVTEVRAGSYIFQDATGVSIGIAKEEDCAIRIVATVVSTPYPGHASIDAGSKTLTSDGAHGRTGYGIVVGHPDVVISSLNEEHGYLQFDPSKDTFKVGQRIEIIPNHGCVVSNLADYVYWVRDGQVEGPMCVDARGKNQ